MNRTFYERAFDDVEQYDEALAKTIQHLQRTQAQLIEFKEQLDKAEGKKCLFCAGTRRDVSAIASNADLFTHLGGNYSSWECCRGHNETVPQQWECQECFAYDSPPPSSWARLWDTDNPGKDTFARHLLKLFPAVKQVAMDKGPVWMVEVAGTWYVLAGTKEEIASKYR